MKDWMFTAIWPVHDPALNVHALALLAEPELLDMVHDAGAILTDTPRWTLHEDRLTAIAPARLRAPWDEADREDAAKAYLLDLMPDAA